MKQKVLIYDFGSQFTQLIARRVRELNIYCEILPYHKKVELDNSVKAVILSGSPYSVRQEDALHIDLEQFINKVPLLGVCYGAQYLAQTLGGEVERSNKREYGKAILSNVKPDIFLQDVSAESQVWMSHGDTISKIPNDFEILACTESIPIAAFRSIEAKYDFPIYAIQFHPEVTHSLEGAKMIKNFLVDIAGCEQNWTPDAFVDQTVEALRQQIGDEKVLLALSGGVDSSVAAMLLHKAIGKNLYCFFVDNGLLRKNEYEDVLDSYKDMGLNVTGVNAKDYFYNELKGKTDPEAKRKAIGKAFIDIFEKEAEEFSGQGVQWLAQGTIYPDVIESVSVHGPSVTIKSHHNVGGLPEKLKLKIVEPLRMLFKDEVRRVGKSLNVPDIILKRHPFPGPGLGIRIIGEVTADKVRLLQEADAIYIENLKKSGWYDQVWQAGTILLPVQSVGVMGDERTYEQTVALRAVNSLDGMTAEWSRLPYELLATISNEIINNVRGINRVVYDISTKPPATIEWE